MGDTSFRKSYPLWVRVGLWGSPNRIVVWMWFWLSLALALACGIYGVWDRRFLGGVLFLVAALMYWLTIRWVDQNGRW